MSYTVKQLAKLSSVSERTLRFYDQIGLLKPAYYGENNYRYYEEAQLLKLQQILFYRELGISLTEIQNIIGSSDFDQVDALHTHKKTIEDDINRKNTLLKTIDKTISHLRGKIRMRDIEMYEGFDLNKQQEYEDYLVDTGTITQKEVDESWDNVKGYKQADWDRLNDMSERVHQGLVAALEKGLLPDSAEVQALVRQHYEWVKHFWTPVRESYIGLGQMYLEHPDFRAFYDKYHPQLVGFLVKAMTVFAERELE